MTYNTIFKLNPLSPESSSFAATNTNAQTENRNWNMDDFMKIVNSLKIIEYTLFIN